MAKNKGLHISKDEIEKIIEDFANVSNSKCMNHKNKQTRYFLNRKDNEFYIDVYFRTDCTITVSPMSSGCNKELSEELVNNIKTYNEYQEVASGSFSCIYDIKKFNALKDYLSSLDGVTKIKDKDNGLNGHILQFKSEIGDKITLTFYQSTSKMLYQGLLMKLYIEVKSFISPSIGNIRTDIKDNKGQAISNKEIENSINKYVPTAYNNLDSLIQGFVRDSFTLLIAKNTLSDYSSWTFPILKALEYRIKHILKYEDIHLDDTIGFKFLKSDGKWYNIFRHNGHRYVLDSTLSNNFSQDTIAVLLECYTCFVVNRHTLFHTKQNISATRILETSEKATTIIFEVCGLLETSYKKLGK